MENKNDEPMGVPVEVEVLPVESEEAAPPSVYRTETKPQTLAEREQCLAALAEDTRRRLKRSALDTYYIGLNLLEAQSLLEHGEFLPWLRREFGMGKTSAYDFIHVARAFQSEFPIIGNLLNAITPTALYKLAAPSCSEAARNEAIERIRAGEVIGPDTAKEIIKKHKSSKTSKAQKLEASLIERQEPINQVEASALPESEERQLDWGTNSLVTLPLKHQPTSQHDKVIEPEIVKKEINYPRYMNYELIEKWLDSMPKTYRPDHGDFEWRKTPVISLDLTPEGYGEVFIKDEADLESNRTRTIKDRAAWELAKVYRGYAESINLKIMNGNLKKADLERMLIPRFSLITVGNKGRAIAERFKSYELPPPKLLIDKTAPALLVEDLKKLRAEIYAIDLSLKELTPKDIKNITGNKEGIDITSIRSFRPEEVFYDCHVHEAFNENPDEIYIPYGSGRLMENYLNWQKRSLFNALSGRQDPRLKAELAKVISMNVLGAEPGVPKSIANKLSVPFKPFSIFKDEDIQALVNLAFTGRETGKKLVEEERIKEAYSLFNKYKIEAEPSAAAGLALYLERFEKGLVWKEKKVLIVSTGKGL